MKRFIYFILIVFAIVGCGKGYTESVAENLKPVKTDPKTRKTQTDEALLKANKVIAEKERKQIKSYIERRKWTMTEYAGVFIQKTHTGCGRAITDSSVVELEYTLDLITGERIYSSQKDGIKKIHFGKTDSEPTGLLYALKTMKEGDNADIIIPSALAYGLYGDGRKIPSHSTLVYNIKITNVK
ncbi:MAG: FKBP-type peptidyl-prolyl cis-trans isomerase [Bacteroidales bacterium]|jgi:FKBP-type peptidyl-prolyl cis-trans isomerase|nr:FKBP-type peptidyl-prolyl cis-trans isomerase [Bacteroidales bacterium]